MNRESIRQGGLSAPLFHQRFVRALCAALLLTLLTGVSASAASPISGFNPAEIEPGATGLSLSATAFCADNILPARSLILNRWGSHFKPSELNNADGYWYTDVGYKYKGWRIAVFDRGELFIESNQDTVDILSMLKMKQDLPVGTDFDIDLKAEGFIAAGAALSRSLDLSAIADGLNAGFTIRYLSAQRIQYGTLEGTVTPTGTKTYDFSLAVDYYYDRNLLYERESSLPESGNGHSLDIGATYSWKNSVEISLLARDLFGRIYWKSLPYTKAEAASDVIYYDSQGYQSYRPTIKGYEGYEDYTQKIPVKTDVDFAYKLGRVKLCSTVNFIRYRPLYWLYTEYSPAEAFTFSLGYNVDYGAYSAGASYKQFRLSAVADSFSYKHANALGLTLSYGLQW